MAVPVGFRGPVQFVSAGPIGLAGPLQLALWILGSCEDEHHVVSPAGLVAPWVQCPAGADGGRRSVRGACVESCSPPAAVDCHPGWGQAWTSDRHFLAVPCHAAVSCPCQLRHIFLMTGK